MLGTFSKFYLLSFVHHLCILLIICSLQALAMTLQALCTTHARIVYRTHMANKIRKVAENDPIPHRKMADYEMLETKPLYEKVWSHHNFIR